MIENSTQKLIRRAKTGDATALEAVLETHRDRLAGYTRLRVGTHLLMRLEVDDVLQETFTKAVESIAPTADIHLVTIIHQNSTEKRCQLRPPSPQPKPRPPWLRQLARRGRSARGSTLTFGLDWAGKAGAREGARQRRSSASVRARDRRPGGIRGRPFESSKDDCSAIRNSTPLHDSSNCRRAELETLIRT